VPLPLLDEVDDMAEVFVRRYYETLNGGACTRRSIADALP